MNLGEYSQFDALGLAELVRTGEVSPRELGQLALDGVEKVNPNLNAVIEVHRDRVEALDESTLPEGPFRGVPFMLKDLGATEAGRKCENGSRLTKGAVSEGDCHLVSQFKRAGLNLMGRTTTPEFGLTATTESTLTGDTANPWNPGRIAGGSSGGSAAIVAAGALPMAHANDGGGSTRIPAGINGLVGLKTSRGRISYGPDGNDLMYPIFSDFAVTRTVRDSAALLDAVSGPMPGEATFYRQPERPYVEELTQPPGKLRVGLCADFGQFRAHPEASEQLAQTGRLLESLGMVVEEAVPDIDFEEFWQLAQDAWLLQLGPMLDEAAEAQGRALGVDTLEPTTVALLDKSRQLGLADQTRIYSWFNRISRQLGQFFTRYDLLLTPTTASPTPNLGTIDIKRPKSVDQYFSENFGYIPYTVLNNFTGTPAICLPLTQWSDGMPAGMHFMAPIGEEGRLIRLAAALEQAAPWADRRPQIHVASA